MPQKSGPPFPHSDSELASLEEIFKNKDYYHRFLCLQGEDAQRALDTCDEILNGTVPLTQSLQGNLIIGMQRLARAAKLLPTRHVLEGISFIDRFPRGRGGFSDIYLGRYGCEDACIKMLAVRTGAASAEQSKALFHSFARESILWSRLSHPNVHPFLGLCEMMSRPCLISPWARNGNINQFLSGTPAFTNRLLLINDIAAGLEYLHNHGVIHGDIKGENVLVDETCRAALADFGLSSVLDTDILNVTQFSSAGSKGGTTGWKAPELFLDSEGSSPDKAPHNTKASDIYSLACTFYEVFTGQLPFNAIDYRVIALKLKGEHPKKPNPGDPAFTQNGLSDEIWGLMSLCWNYSPSERPEAEYIVGWLQGRTGHDFRPKKQGMANNSLPLVDTTTKPVHTAENGLEILLRYIFGDNTSGSRKSRWPGFRRFMTPLTPETAALRTDTRTNASSRRLNNGIQFVHYT